ncbi:hypothetical protein GCM10011491_21870 [Brucella endophytica]|uniref:Uncharacterized protein n=1 Tax=Brucella endophytica TaxID=1963359 RepID=A0A916SD38_9HYPH|nr:hypothetical protein [Brucella endophytica]GGA93376.1 hypothetical protein GCM10011491_21870 [Brucella endophytica]
MLLRRFTIFSLFLMGLAILTGGIVHEARKASAQKPLFDVTESSGTALQ